MTISIDAEADGRQGRIFLGDLQSLGALAEFRLRFAQGFMDAVDARRLARLDTTLQRPTVTAFVHPGKDPTDIVQVFLKTEEPLHPRAFACTITPGSRLGLLLRDAPALFESFDLQVAHGPSLSVAAIRLALEVWASRNFPRVRVPAFELSLWANEETLNLLPILVGGEDRKGTTLVGEECTSGPEAFRPNPNLAQPAYEGAA